MFAFWRPAALPHIPSSAGIPRILHQTVRDKRTLPPDIAANIEHLRALNPGWDYRLSDDADVLAFVRRQYGAKVARRFHRIHPDYGAVKADLFRYLVAYRLGGVYLDIKSSLTRPLDDILQPDDRLLLSQWRNGPGEPHETYGLWPEVADLPGGEYQQWFVVAAPGQPGLRDLIVTVLAAIDDYDADRDGTGRHATLRLSGPLAFTRAVLPYAHDPGHRLVRAETDLGFVYSIFEGQTHTRLFERHYGASSAPIILPKPVRG